MTASSSFLSIIHRAAEEDPAALEQLPAAAARLLACITNERVRMPIPALARKDFAQVIEVALSDFAVRKAWKFVQDGKAVIRATRRFKENRRNTRGELLVTYGVPNYAERKLLTGLRRRQEAVPKHVQTQPWPVKKSSKKAKAKTRAKGRG